MTTVRTEGTIPMNRYESVGLALFTVGLLLWMVWRSADPTEALLWRGFLWAVGAGLAGYGLGLRHGGAQRDEQPSQDR